MNEELYRRINVCLNHFEALIHGVTSEAELSEEDKQVVLQSPANIKLVKFDLYEYYNEKSESKS